MIVASTAAVIYLLDGQKQLGQILIFSGLIGQPHMAAPNMSVGCFSHG